MAVVAAYWSPHIPMPIYGQRTMTPKVICEQTRVEYKIFHKHVTVFRESNSSEKVKCLAIFMVKLESLKKEQQSVYDFIWCTGLRS